MVSMAPGACLLSPSPEQTGDHVSGSAPQVPRPNESFQGKNSSSLRPQILLEWPFKSQLSGSCSALLCLRYSHTPLRLITRGLPILHLFLKKYLWSPCLSHSVIQSTRAVSTRAPIHLLLLVSNFSRPRGWSPHPYSCSGTPILLPLKPSCPYTLWWCPSTNITPSSFPPDRASQLSISC